jgi:hypothetical protein
MADAALTLRDATSADAERVRDLITELGHPTSPQMIHVGVSAAAIFSRHDPL